MTSLKEIASNSQQVDAHHPWPRAVVTDDAWQVVLRQLVDGRATLLGLWAEPRTVHLALIEEVSSDIAVFSLACKNGRFPSVAAVHPPAIRLERAIRDLYGLRPTGLADTRPWLDLGFWGVTHPLSSRPRKTRGQPSNYPFLPVEGEGLHQIPVGPVHAGIIEPGHFRFTANGEAVVRLEERLGYVHKGIESLMIGAELDKGAQLAGRASGDSTVAYALAFSQAVEVALGVEAPPRAIWLRALMAELERLANHLGDIGAICNDASFSLMHAECGILRERTLRAAQTGLGHRLMMDRIVPGGLTQDLNPGGLARLGSLLELVERRFPELIEIYDNTASLQDRTVGTGYLAPTLARAFGAGGYVGRASGRAFDARAALLYPPYEQLEFEVPVRDGGDVNARVWLRIREVEQSLRLIGQVLEQLPSGPVRMELDPPGRVREGMALVEGFRGDILVAVRLDEEGRIERCHLRDPSWFQWPLLEAAIEGNIVADFPLCNKSFNCSYAGHDL
ncbi:MAG TPA: NADH-quinone oxidoreductase subunit C [Alphaproteobacteria bacterium]|nr:NADH-quinone oxidoreductase subunit C [Alphaproteobacteria bacterium]